jgi:hypothetical protein
MELHLLTAWVGVALGMIGGAIVGLLFDREQFAGGYGSWRRRLMRLGHISFFGVAFINLMFVLTAGRIEGSTVGICSPLLIAGAITMPLVCYLSAWRPGFRRAFFIPVTFLLAPVVIIVLAILN